MKFKIDPEYLVAYHLELAMRAYENLKPAKIKLEKLNKLVNNISVIPEEKKIGLDFIRSLEQFYLSLDEKYK